MGATELSPTLRRLIAATVADEIGAGADWRLPDRSVTTPMNALLDEAARRLPREVVVVWVNGGFPELLALPDLSVPTVIYSTRFVELGAAVRSLLIDERISQLRAQVAERLALAIMAEQLLRRDDLDSALRCFLGSLAASGLVVPFTNTLDDLELADKSEAYVATWFFGLAHELGHCTPVLDIPLLSSEALEESVRTALEEFPWAAELDLDDLLGDARRDPDHPLRGEHVRGEVMADLFAAEVLLDATDDILRRTGREFDPLRFLPEVFAFANVVAFVERCSGLAKVLAGGRRPHLMRRYAVQPAAFSVRLGRLHWFVTQLMGNRHGALGDNSRMAQWERVVDEASEILVPAIQGVETGLAQAMRLALADTPTTDELFARAQLELATSARGFVAPEIERFRALAATRGLTSSALDRLAAS